MTPRRADDDGRERVAILGGGPAALAAAFELTATEELQQQYDVTVYQLGWRLGGKGASGRNAKYGQRIEEHGLHIWFGFYDNAFSLMRRCYSELNRDAGKPLSKWTDAFEPDYNGVAYEYYKNQWVPHFVELPEHDGEPGDPGGLSFWEVLKAAGDLLQGQYRNLRGQYPGLTASETLPAPPRGLDRRTIGAEGRRLGAPIDDRAPVLSRLELVSAKADERIQIERRVVRGPALFGIGSWAQRASLAVAATTLGEARDIAWNSVKNRIDNKDLRFFFMVLDLVATMVKGIYDDRLPEKGFGSINGEDFREWLRRHEANELTVEGCPLVRSVYSAAFCFEDGDTQKPRVAAGKAAQDVIRLPLFYKGAPMYRMRAGMGDVVFAPLYEVLKERKVKFKFFHWIKELKLSRDKTSVDRIKYIRQAKTRAGVEYEPLIDVKGLPCWPNEPRWTFLEGGDALQDQGVNFETDPNPPGSKEDVLKRDRDFHSVVLAIPVGALPPICRDLSRANSRFKDMLDNSHTVMTQAFQLWMKSDARALRNPYPSGTLTSCYVEPVDTYSDMSQTLDCEDWPAGDDVALVAYFCGVLPSDQVQSQTQAETYVRNGAIQFMQNHVAELWPAFDWDAMFDPQNRQGDARFEAQYWRANCSLSEQYALTLPGKVRYRLWPHESGFDNLVLAGDWTRNGINGGAVEAAVTSGMLASRAVCRSPATVEGVSGWLMSDKGDVDYTPPVPVHG